MYVWQMAFAAIAHVFVFSAQPYHCFLLASDHHYGRVTTKMEKKMLEIEEGKEKKPAVVERTETQVKAPGTSITESVQDIVVEGGQQVSHFA